MLNSCRFIVRLLIFSVFAFFFRTEYVLADTPDNHTVCEKNSRQMMERVAAGDFPGASVFFNAAMKAALPPETFSAVWQSTLAANGTFAGLGQSSLQSETGSAIVVLIPIRFSLNTIDAAIACDESGAVGGLHFVPHEISPKISSVDDSGFSEKRVRIRNDDIELGASYFKPKLNLKTFPAVLMLGGSGPTDRDGTIGPNRPLRDLAIGLAAKGVVVLAFDKRTFAYPGRPVSTIQEEVIDDAVSALRFLESRKDVDPDRIYLLGHSFGGTLAPLVAKMGHGVSGLVLLAPSLESLDVAYLRQIRYLAKLDGHIDESEEARLEDTAKQLESLQRIKAGRELDGPLPMGVPLSYWKSLWEYDPVSVARETGLPILALFAGRDYQVLADSSLAELKFGLPEGQEFEAHIYRKLGHTFMPMDDPPNPATLMTPGHVSAEVVDEIARWIHRHHDLGNEDHNRKLSLVSKSRSAAKSSGE
jgi:uncharacterized protein